MPDYRRIFLPGGTYFFTVVTYDRQPIFSNIKAINIFRRSIQDVMLKHPFKEVAYCILPDHIHAIWTLPEDDFDYPLRWRAIKSIFTFKYLSQREPGDSLSGTPRRRGEASVWQRRYWEHTIRDEKDFTNHFDYIHFNPVKHGLVPCVRDWKWSSFDSHVKNGIYPPDWGDDKPPKLLKFTYGE